MSIPVRNSPRLGMDADTDIKNIRNGTYLPDAKNVRHKTTSGNTTDLAQNILGNELAYFVSAATRQNKQIAIAVNAVLAGSGQISFQSSPNGGATTTAPFTIPINDVESALTNLVTASNIVMNPLGYPVFEIDRTVNNNTFGSVIIEIGGLTDITQGIDWIVNVVSGSVTLLGTRQEAIPQGLVGEWNYIAGNVVNNVGFNFWTTQKELPSLRTVIGATNLGPITITEGSETDPNYVHGLSDGDIVSISGVRGNISANGTWVIDVVSPTQYDLIGSLGSGNASISISSGAQYLATGLVQITTTTSHGINTNEKVFITGSDATANGYWIVTATSTTTLVLEGSTFVAAFGAGGTVIKVATSSHNPKGLGEIGAITRTNDTYNYTRLLRSTELNFRTKKQLDVRSQFYADIFSLYFVDAFNVDRVFSYEKPADENFITDGAIVTINPLGRYSYGNINSGMKQTLVPDEVTINFETQFQQGGFVDAGNVRYAVRFLTETNEATNFSRLSNPINTYAEPISNVVNILGTAATNATSKANQIRISGINNEIYPQIQVAAILQTGGSFTGEIIGTFNVPEGGELLVTHFGNETSTEELDLTTLNALVADILNSKNIEILDNRLHKSNINATPEYDLTAWAQTFNYGIYKGILNPVGSGEAPILGEYQDPNNVFNFSSGMLNETYRFGVELRNEKTGVWTRVYHIGDFTIDTTAVGGRRIATLTDFNLTDTPTPPDNATETYYFFLRFTNIDFDFVLPNGQSIREEYDRIRFSRADIEGRRTVLQTGVLCTKSSTAPGDRVNANHTYLTPAGTGTLPTTIYAVGASDVRRQAGILYSADNLLGGETFSFVNGDELYTYGQPLYQKIRATGAGASALGSGTLTELYGAYASSPTIHSLTGITSISSNELKTISGTNIRADGEVAGVGSGLFIRQGIAFLINTTFITDTAALMPNDYGIYYYQYIRPSSNQYGNASENSWIDLNASYAIDNSLSVSTEFDVYLQDVFTQKTYIRIYETNNPAAFGKISAFYSQNVINSQMRNDDAPNRFVFPKGNGSNDTFDNRINQVVDPTNLEPWEYNFGYNYRQSLQSSIGFNENFPKQISYPTRIHYSPFKNSGSLVDYFRVFLPFDFYDEDERYGPILSMQAVNGNLYTWQPDALIGQYVSTRAQFDNVDNTQAVIIGSGNVYSQRGRLINTIGLSNKWGIVKVNTTNGYDAVYWINTEKKKLLRFGGDGTRIISEDERGGNRMRAFLDNNLRWVEEVDTPADGLGVHIGINLRYSEVYLTVRGKKSVAAYDNTITYSLNDEVEYEPNLYDRNFEQTGEIYKYINPTPTSGNLPTDTGFWEKIAHTNSDFYNEYTLVYDEDRNTFECFYDIKPIAWFSWDNVVFSPRPISDTGRMYLHDKGFYNRWYVQNGETLGNVTKVDGSLTVTGTSGNFFNEFQVGFGMLVNGTIYTVVSVESNTSLTLDTIFIDGNGNIQDTALNDSFATAAYVPICQQLEHGLVNVVFNYEPHSSKRFETIFADTSIHPFRMDFETNEHISFLNRVEFDDRYDFYESPIKNDSTNTGLNNGDTSRLFGQYLKTSLTFRYLEFQVLNSLITKMQLNQRNFRK